MRIIKILVKVELGEDTRPGAYIVDLPEALRYHIARQADLVAAEATDGQRPRVTAIVSEQRPVQAVCVACKSVHRPLRSSTTGLCIACQLLVHQG